MSSSRLLLSAAAREASLCGRRIAKGASLRSSLYFILYTLYFIQDCEGCEWEAFRYLASEHPRLLCTVRQINVELHVRYSGLLTNASDLPALLKHLWIDHGFRVFRSVPNTGWTASPGRARRDAILPDLVRSPVELNTTYCCYNLQMVRPAVRNAPGAPAQPWQRWCNLSAIANSSQGRQPWTPGAAKFKT